MTRNQTLILTTVGILHLAIYIALAYFRYVDGDEGFYLVAAGSVSEGRAPYRDFFYNQMPLWPYIWAAWMSLTDFSITAGRILSVLFSTSTLALVAGYLMLRRVTLPTFGIALVALAFNGFALIWHPTARTESVVTFLLVASFLCSSLSIHGDTPSRQLLLTFISGLLLSFAFQVRLLVLPVTAAFFAWHLIIARRSTRKAAQTHTGVFLLAIVLGSLPSAALIAADPQAAWFNVITFHQYRGIFSPLESFAQKLLISAQVLGQAQWAMLAVGVFTFALTSPWRSLPGNKDLQKAALTTGIISFGGLSAFYPTPVQPPYFAPFIPFLVLIAAEVLERWQSWEALHGKLAVWGILMLYTLGAIPIVFDFTYRDSDRVNAAIRPSTVREAAQVLRDATLPTDVVHAIWPGYAFESQRPLIPGTENHGWLVINENLTAEMARRYHLVRWKEFIESIETEPPKAIVLGIWTPASKWEEMIHRMRGTYHRALDKAGTEVWIRDGQ